MRAIEKHLSITGICVFAIQHNLSTPECTTLWCKEEPGSNTIANSTQEAPITCLSFALNIYLVTVIKF